MKDLNVPNKLFFIATFQDGEQVFQNAEDRSPSNEKKNCFYDIRVGASNVADNDYPDFNVAEITKRPLKCVVLAAENMPTFGVDLEDGHFEVNGVPFFQHTEPLRDFRLVYYRNVSQHRTVSAGGGESTDWAEVGYDLGWEADYEGKIIRRVMRIV
jgi:hypothetical protein